MKETKYKFSFSAPIDKNGVTIKLNLINVEKLNTLRISHYPEFTWYTIGIGFLFGFSLIAALIDLSNLIWASIAFGIIIFNLYNQRAFDCSINKETGSIIYSRSGFLMSSFDEQKKEFSVSEIERLEMQRHIKGWWRWEWAEDTFQIFLLFKTGQKLPLSPKNLNFGECQEFTEQIRSFLGNEIPIKALD